MRITKDLDWWFYSCLFFGFFFLAGFPAPGWAQSLKVAAAANMRFVITTLQADFKKKTGIEMTVVTGSSGKLTAQIKNGAPYDLFLSADMDFPDELYKTGFTIGRPKVYAHGSLIICSGSGLDLKDWKTLLSGSLVDKIVIANPALAPYGRAAEQYLKQARLWEKLQPKLIRGESISQVNTYLVTAAVPLGFTTEALIYEYRASAEYPKRKPLQWARVDVQAYQPILQGMVLLKYSKKENYATAVKFFNYLFLVSGKDAVEKKWIPDSLKINHDWTPIWLSLKLSLITTLILLVIGLPIAYWLSKGNSIFKLIIEAISTMPLVLPPSVLGFYLLLAFNPGSTLGKFLQEHFDVQLVFSFPGLVVASVIYSLPFMISPVKSAFTHLPRSISEASSTMGKSEWQTFFQVLMPNIKSSVLTAAVITFAHTMGEFGVVLMIGGNIPGVSKTASIAIYDAVEGMDYGSACSYSMVLFLISFSIIIGVFVLNRKSAKGPLEW